MCPADMRLESNNKEEKGKRKEGEEGRGEEGMGRKIKEGNLFLGNENPLLTY